MPSSRIQVNPDAGIPDPSLRVTAQPTDTYVRPTEEENQASQLAQALSGLAPNLARVGGMLADRQNQASLEAGAENARETVTKLDASRKTYAQATADGTIAPQNNPWMKQGYYEELGRTYAGRLQSDMTTAMQQDEGLKNSIEMSDFRKFTSDFETNWKQQNLPADVQKNSAFQVGYGNRRDAVLQSMEDGWSAQTEQRFTHQSLTMFRDDSENFINDALDKGQSFDQIGSYLRQTWDDKHAIGWDARLTGSSMIDAMSDVAISRKDPTLLSKLLAAVPVGKDGSRLSSSYATAKEQETSSKVFDQTRQDWAVNQHDREDTSRGIQDQAAQRFVDAESKGLNVDQVDVSDLRKQALDNGDPALERQLVSMSKAYGKTEYQDDPDTVAGIMEKLHQSPYALKQQSLNDALDARHLSLSTFNQLSGQLREYQDYAQDKAKENAKEPSGPPVFLENDRGHKYVQDQLDSYFKSDPTLPDPPGLAAAKATAKRELSEWYFKNVASPDGEMHGLSGMKLRTTLDAEAHDMAHQYAPSDPFSGFSGLSRDKNMEWKKAPVDIPERVQPLLDELQSGKRPSPAAISLLNAYHIDLTKPQMIQDFITAQRKYLTQPPSQ